MNWFALANYDTQAGHLKGSDRACVTTTPEADCALRRRAEASWRSGHSPLAGRCAPMVRCHATTTIGSTEQTV